ncbi:hypothetical protein [Bradyrhizobium sp. ARR65]|nr:hypothetical protein [Bradyrhizobium sp. ARR65]
MMLPLLLTARTGMIFWVTLALIPFEIAFEAVEAGIEREMARDGD